MRPCPPDEAELVEAARHDREAFGTLYDRYFDAIYHYIAVRVEDTAVAEDLAASVWERALRAIESYQLRGVPFLAWLYRIAGNLVANHHRRRRLLQMIGLSPREPAPERGASVEDRLAVRAAYDRLPLADQEVLALCYFADLSTAQMAEVLGCSEPAVHKRLQRARSRLRALFEEDEGVAAPDRG